jgi:hypothetical protein
MHRQLTCLPQGDSSSLAASARDVADILSDSIDNGLKNVLGLVRGCLRVINVGSTYSTGISQSLQTSIRRLQ